MPGIQFKQDVRQETGRSWEDWLVLLNKHIDHAWSHDQIKEHICQEHETSDDWGEWIAVLYEQLMGRSPVGVTKDAGVQIGVRKTIAVTKERAWNFLTSQAGVSLWIGDVQPIQWQVGYEFQSREGVSGKLTVVKPYQKLRLTWQRPSWDRPSRLQIYVLSNDSGSTTVAIHQEMLEDVYMREVMKRFWTQTIEQMKKQLEQG
ncbi:MAG: Activator of Hsp90 ATPase 1 family protein [Paenibacillus sp.]|nr:Activator of Hsp90 ATPase 1 family protein [Paenibacillus sp.]